MEDVNALTDAELEQACGILKASHGVSLEQMGHKKRNVVILGMMADAFAIPDDFDKPLPEKLINEFYTDKAETYELIAQTTAAMAELDEAAKEYKKKFNAITKDNAALEKRLIRIDSSLIAIGGQITEEDAKRLILKTLHEIANKELLRYLNAKKRNLIAAVEIRTPNVRDGKFVWNDLLFTDPNSYKVWTARGQPRVGDVHTLSIPHPVKIDEQTAIADTLNGIVTNLRNLVNDLQKYSRLKAGLMHDLLTGKVRLTDIQNPTLTPESL